ncbi:GumC family protein, partial [Arachidicoccus sp.]|uniref:GumC family protein n=1 Tax=Arachidicoccus sp. TaxID=1872624 RepID=UPI003D1D0DD5
MSKNIQDQESASESINLKAELSKYTQKWYWFVLGVLICMISAFIYLRYATPQYSISTELLIRDDKKGPDVSSMMGGGAVSSTGSSMFSDLGLFNSQQNIDNEIEVLKSQSLLQRTFAKMPQLQTSIFVNGTFKSAEVYGDKAPIAVHILQLDSTAYKLKDLVKLKIKSSNSFELTDAAGSTIYSFGQRVNRTYGSFMVNALSTLEIGQTIDLQFHDLRIYADEYNKKITIAAVNQNASALTISMNDAVPQKGIDIIKELVAVYNQEGIEDKNQISTNTINFINARLVTLVQELSGVEKKVADFKQQNKITDITGDVQAFYKQAADLYTQKEQASVQANVLKSIQDYVNTPGNKYSLVPSSLGIQDPTLNGLVDKFNELQLKRKEQLTTVQPSNILVKNLDASIADVRRSISENLSNIQQGMAVTQKDLNGNYQQFQTLLHSTPEVQRQLLEIQRQQVIKEGLYSFLLQQKEASQLSLAATVANSRTINDPAATDSPVSPKRMLVYLAAFLLGLIIPFAALYGSDLLDDKVRLQKDITDKTDVPILGEIAHAITDHTLIVKDKVRTPVAEMFRLMRSNLQFAALDKDIQVILSTSSMSGEGKTFFCTNLGASMALTGKKVVVLEFDIRKPKLLKGLGMNA